MSNFELMIKLLLQLTFILATCRIVTIIGRRYLGQTDVVCEMITGVMLVLMFCAWFTDVTGIYAIFGALMNARGLMELIILNVGLEQGVITPILFTIMVIMAIVTTLMASPLVAFFLQERVVLNS